MNIKVIAFDADDTLWVNEPYFLETETKFCQMMETYLPQHTVAKELFRTEIDNLSIYGYGIKGYILSMIETAIRISGNTMGVEAVGKIMDYGKEMLTKQVELIDEVEDTLKALHGRYKLVVATKGDLKDQHRKLHESGLGHYFHHIEVMSDKQQADYKKMIARLDIKPEELLMVGNSLKSDVLPVLEIGGHACHIPFHTTWAHEVVDHTIEHENFLEAKKISEILGWL
jgi:putative hydrolase of the HAD superfamily